VITQVEVFTPRVAVPPIDVTDGDASSDPIQIRNIDGLGPVPAAINTSQYGSIEGEFYNGSTKGKRNIVMTVGLNPNWANQTMEGLRQLLYSYFMTGNEVTLRITSTHMATVEITGYVETFEPNMFSKDPEMQISIICPQPALIAVAATVVTGVVGALPDVDPTIINYQGTEDCGFVLDVTDLGGASPDLNGELRFAIGYVTQKLFITDAIVDSTHFFRVSTVQGDKYVHEITIPGGVETSVLGTQVPGSAWMQLEEGANQFRVMSEAPGQAWSLQYYARYGGI
jgi:hypothetical protein